MPDAFSLVNFGKLFVMVFVFLISELILLFFLSKILTKSLSNLLYIITKSEKATVNILFILFLPGIIIHELSHLLMAGILFVPAGDIELVPKMGDGYVRMGSVQIAQTDPIRRAIIGFSPVMVGVFILLFTLFFFSSNTFSNNLVYMLALFIVFEIGNTMYSSPKDLEGTAEVLGSIIFIFAVLYIAGIRLPQSFFNFLGSSEITSQITKADLLLGIPIFIDLFLGGGLNFLIRKRIV